MQQQHQQRQGQHHHNSRGGNSNGNNGSSSYTNNNYDFIERSTSAPPPETSFLFGNGGPSSFAGTDSPLGDGLDVLLQQQQKQQQQQQFLDNNSYHQQRALNRRGNNGNHINTNNHNNPLGGRYDDILEGGSNNGLGASSSLSPESLFLDSIKNGKSPPPPGFSPKFHHLNTTTSNRNSNGHGGTDDGLLNLSSLDRRTIGENLVRSQSAAPAIDSGRLFSSSSGGDGGLSGLGLGGARGNNIHHHLHRQQQHDHGSLFGLGGGGGLASSETPVVSNRTDHHSLSTDTSSSAAAAGRRSGMDSYLESNLSSDRSHILQLGQRRSASTGIIGDNHHVNISSSVLESLGLGDTSRSGDGGGRASHSGGGTGGRTRTPPQAGAVRPAPKNIMDLIQEDYPPESPLDAQVDVYGQDYNRDLGFGLDRPRTTSPTSSSINYQRDQQYQRQQEQNYPNFVAGATGGGGGPRGRVEPNIRINPSDQYNLPRGGGGVDNLSSPRNVNYYDQNFVQPDNNRLPPEYALQQNEDSSHVQASQYAPSQANFQPSRPRPLRPGQHAPPAQFDQNGTVFGGSQQQNHIQVHVLPNGQTVYVHSQPPQGYPTNQFHPQQQQQMPQRQQQYAANTFSNGMPLQNDQQQYVSVVPIQRNGSPPGGSYAYVPHPNDSYGGPRQPVTFIPGGNGNDNGLPVRVTNAGQSYPPQPQVQQRQTQQRKPQQQQPMTGSPSGSGGRGAKEKPGRGNRRGGGVATANVANPSQRRSGGNDSRTSAQNGNGSPTHNDVVSAQSLLEEFKAKKHSRDWTIKEIKGHVVEFCQDQNGSRFVQQRLEVGDAAEKAIAMTEVLPAIRTLRNDVFGNYVVQKLLDFGSPSMKEQIRDTMTGEMVELSVQMYGCRVVQKALESLDETSMPKFLEEFHSSVISLIQDQNGNHVIQKCIEIISQKARQAQADGDAAKAKFLNEQIDFIVDDVHMNVNSLSCHPYGCRVLQRILEHCTEEKKNHILDELKPSHRRLFDDQYGNYVIQHVLQFGRVGDRDMVLQIIVENGLLKLSKQKFASNVVEKLLKYGNAEQRKAIAREMLKTVDEDTDEVATNGSHGTSVILLMVRDAYANYVVQTTIDVVPPQSKERKKLIDELSKHSAELKNYTFAKHIVSKLTT
eukprot:CAMPEP_0113483310 /NCGR_PEP_ID=MMETSP0014_2-20120614/23368_1 /TAXON_ID=2857 /ORGANISM="Nitzschia sp." /LENGTH=1146 /DNA_ID=CAMNT_0000376853 /DNA_START=282 /DNA_END=3722 /DNA_ORIENTATION=- /assembly_acc=CAM_ASM_000159